MSKQLLLKRPAGKESWWDVDPTTQKQNPIWKAQMQHIIRAGCFDSLIQKYSFTLVDPAVPRNPQWLHHQGMVSWIILVPSPNMNSRDRNWYARATVLGYGGVARCLGISPATVTPEKVDPKRYHHVLSPMCNGFECRKCSAFSMDINDLKAVPCLRGSMPSMSEDELKHMVENQSKKVEHFKKLLKLKELERKVGELERKRKLAASSPPCPSAPTKAPQACRGLSQSSSRPQRLRMHFNRLLDVPCMLSPKVLYNLS